MSKLVCDICGGKLTLVSGGTAVCDNCGINYSKEYLKEKVKESIACVKQTVKINIEENLRRTKVYLSESNFRDAKKYVSEILEVEDSNWLAKLYKVMCEEKFYINPDETSLERKLNYYNYKNKNIKFPIVQDKILDIVKEINVLNIDADEKIKIMNALAACLCRVGTAKSYYYSKLYYDKVLYSDSEPSVEL